MSDIQPHIEEGTIEEDSSVFHYVCFGNFSGTTEEKDDYAPVTVNTNTWDDLFNTLQPVVNLTVSLPKVPDVPVRLAFKGLSDFNDKGLASQVPLLRDIDALVGRIRGATTASPFQVADVLNEHGSLFTVKNLAEEHGKTKTIDLLSMVDLGEDEDELQLPKLATFFKTTAYGGDQAEKVIAELDRVRDMVMSQVSGNETLKKLHGQWRGLQWFLKYHGTRVRISLVDCMKREFCDATYMVYVHPENRDPLPLDMAFYCEEFDLSEDDYHILYHLGRMAESLSAPFIVNAAPAMLKCKTWKHLSHVRDFSTRFASPSHIKWRKLRDQPGSQWLFMTVNPPLARIAESEEDPDDTAVLVPSSFYPALLLTYHMQQGNWPGDLVGPLGSLALGNGCIAHLEEEQGNDLAYYGLCAVGAPESGEYLKLAGMNCFGDIKLKVSEKLQAKTLLEFTLSYHFFAGCCSRFLHANYGTEDFEKRFRAYTRVKEEGDLEHEEMEGQSFYRLKAPFNIFGIQPDLLLSVDN